MSIGDQSDFLNRLQRLMPQGWFAQGMVPVRDALLTGIANAFAFVFGLLAYVRNQTRIATATDGFLDLIALDFFGNSIFRGFNQTDTSFRSKISVNLFRSRGTRASVIAVLQQLTGQTPFIFEPARAADTGAYNTGTLAYGTAGGYGSLALNYQSFVTAYTGSSIGIPNVAGYGISTGGYSRASRAAYEDPSQNQLTYADIYAAINSVRPIGYTIWVCIVAGSAATAVSRPSPTWDSSFSTIDSTASTFDQA